MMMTDAEYLFKVCVMGDSGVGKYSLISRYVSDKFSADPIKSLGRDYKVKTIKVESQTIKLQIWYGASSESEYKTEYRGAHALVVCFDLSDPDSYKNAKEKYLPICKNFHSRDAVILFVGCKSDLCSIYHNINSDVAEFCKNNKIIYVETSSQKNTGVETVFHEASTALLRGKFNPTQVESLRSLQDIVKRQFNTYLLSMSQSSSGTFSSYTQPSNGQYKLQQEYRENYEKYFDPNNFLFTEKNFVETTLDIIGRSNTLYKTESPVASKFVSSRLARTLMSTLVDLSKASSVINAYVNKPAHAERNYEFV